MFREGKTPQSGYKLRGEWTELLFMTRATEHRLKFTIIFEQVD